LEKIEKENGVRKRIWGLGVDYAKKKVLTPYNVRLEIIPLIK